MSTRPEHAGRVGITVFAGALLLGGGVLLGLQSCTQGGTTRAPGLGQQPLQATTDPAPTDPPPTDPPPTDPPVVEPPNPPPVT